MMAVCLTPRRSRRGRGGAGLEGLVLSNCVYGLNTIISPCDSLIECLRSEAESPLCPLCVTSHVITLQSFVLLQETVCVLQTHQAQ